MNLTISPNMTTKSFTKNNQNSNIQKNVSFSARFSARPRVNCIKREEISSKQKGLMLLAASLIGIFTYVGFLNKNEENRAEMIKQVNDENALEGLTTEKIDTAKLSKTGADTLNLKNGVKLIANKDGFMSIKLPEQKH